MNCKISHEKIDSFVGNVLPVWLVSDEDISKADITWSVDDPDTLGMRTHGGTDPLSIAHVALITLKKPGKSTLKAEFEGKTYVCEVEAREAKRSDPNAKFNYYVGDFHDHMSNFHGKKDFAERDFGFPDEYIQQLDDENLLDFAVISDHAATTNPRDFVRGFVDNAKLDPQNIVIFPGTESEVTVVEEDRFGLRYKKSGEVVTVNCDNFANVRSWEAFYEAMSSSPFIIGVFAHPYVMGYSTPGIWNFCFEEINTPLNREIFKGVEMGDGTSRDSQLIYENAFPYALDNGYRVSPTCASDWHGPTWSYNVVPGKTVIMAEEKSKEAFYDALLARRFYATESGNVKLYYTVNGYPAASDLPMTNVYKFHIDISYFHDDPTTAIKRCDIISNGGKVLKSILADDISVLDVEIESETATYFYLRMYDGMGRRTWSSPVWTGRDAQAVVTPEYVPVDKTGFTAVELESGADASVLVNDNPIDEWHSELCHATYVIDMKEEKSIAALGFYTPYIRRIELERAEIDTRVVIAGFVSKYRISVSCDGVNYKECTDGYICRYSGEQMIGFEQTKARYLKFEALTTVGQESWRPQYAECPLILSELSVFDLK